MFSKGDLVRVHMRPTSAQWFNNFHGKVGVITKAGMRGPIGVWWVLLEGGQQQSFEPRHLVEVE